MVIDPYPATASCISGLWVRAKIIKEKKSEQQNITRLFISSLLFHSGPCSSGTVASYLARDKRCEGVGLGVGVVVVVIIANLCSSDRRHFVEMTNNQHVESKTHTHTHLRDSLHIIILS